jgi:hypothetical protein
MPVETIKYEKLKSKFACPAGGWVYKDEDTKKVCSASGLDRLVDMVVRHRKANNLEVSSDTAKIVEHQICRRLPDNLVLNRVSKVEGFDMRLFNVERETQALLQRWVKAGRPLVDNAITVERSEICQHCSGNLKFGCLTCRGLDGWVFSWIGQNRRNGYEGVLHGCKYGGCLLWAMVNMPITVLPSADGSPEQCWRRIQDGNKLDAKTEQ